MNMLLYRKAKNRGLIEGKGREGFRATITLLLNPCVHSGAARTQPDPKRHLAPRGFSSQTARERRTKTRQTGMTCLFSQLSKKHKYSPWSENEQTYPNGVVAWKWQKCFLFVQKILYAYQWQWHSILKGFSQSCRTLNNHNGKKLPTS